MNVWSTVHQVLLNWVQVAEHPPSGREVRVAKRYLTWLVLAHETAFPRDVNQMTEYLQARHSEPCGRGPLKNTHSAFTFLEDRLTQRALYGTVYKELLATATLGREPRQPPRIPAAILEGLESTVVVETCVFFPRTYA